MSLPTLKEFEQQCRMQDFLYYHSDDHSVWTKGREKQEAIQKVASSVCSLASETSAPRGDTSRPLGNDTTSGSTAVSTCSGLVEFMVPG